MDKYGLAIYNENRVKKRLSTYLDCGGLASVIFPTMYLSGDGTLKMWIYGIAVVTAFGGITAFLWKTGLKRYNSVSS